MVALVILVQREFECPKYLSHVPPFTYDGSCYDGYLEGIAWARVKGMMSTISCAEVISVSASCSRCYSLT